jgi:hypothetical protein
MASSIDPAAKKFATAISRLDHVLHRTPSGPEKVCLGAVKLRLTRWGEAVGIYDPVALEHQPRVDPEDVQVIKDALTGMVALIDHELEVHQDLSLHIDNPDMSLFAAPLIRYHYPVAFTLAGRSPETLQQEMEVICHARLRGHDTELMTSGTRQEASQLLTSCAINVAEQMAKLIADLESCFPAAAEQRRLCEDEIQRLQGLGTAIGELVRAHACWPSADPPLNAEDEHFMTVVREDSSHCVCM